MLWAQGRDLPATHFVPVTMWIAAAIGAFALGHWQDRVGHRLALAIMLWGWIVMTLLAVLAASALLCWVAAVIARLRVGSSQSAGRAMARLLAPADRLAGSLACGHLRWACRPSSALISHH